MCRSNSCRPMSLFVLCSILLQTSVLSSARSVAMPVPSPTPAAIPIQGDREAQAPLRPIEFAPQLVAAEIARLDPAPAAVGEMLPLGTLATSTPISNMHRFFLPFGTSKAESSTEIALYPDIWLAATAKWEKRILDGAMARYPSGWHVVASIVQTDSHKFSFANLNQKIEVIQERKASASHPLLSAYLRMKYQVRDVTVKGLRAWKIIPTDETDLCTKVIVDVADHWMIFQQESLGDPIGCQDQSTFSLVVSSLQLFSVDKFPEDISLFPPSTTQSIPSQVTAINYNRQATVIYQQTYSPPGCISGACSNDDGYRVPLNRDGPHYAAHVLQSGGFPIHWAVGQDNTAYTVTKATEQRAYLESLIPQGIIDKVIDPAKMKPGDYIHMTDGYLGALVARPPQ